MQKRLIKISLISFAILLCGGAVLLIYIKTGWGIPCIFHELTGLNCPGCGNTHAVLGLIHFDFYSAFRANMMFPAEFAYIAYVFIYCSRSYVKRGFFRYRPNICPVDIISLVAFTVWGILRNIFSV